MGERVRYRPAPPPVEAMPQPVAFVRAIANLISNALRYGGEAIVADIIRKNEGGIAFEDRDGGGLRVILRLKAA